MSKELIVSAGRHETRVAILEDDQVVELFHEREKEYSLAGSIHKGRVTRVLPGMQSAFVDIGLERDAFLYVSDFFEDNDEYDAVVSTVEEKILKLERGGAAPIFSPDAIAAAATTVEGVVPAPRSEEARSGGRPDRGGNDRGPSAGGDRGGGDRGGSDRGAGDRGAGGGAADRGRGRGRRRRGGRSGGLPDSKFFSPKTGATDAEAPAGEPVEFAETELEVIAAEPENGEVIAPVSETATGMAPLVAQFAAQYGMPAARSAVAVRHYDAPPPGEGIFVLPGESLAKYSGDEAVVVVSREEPVAAVAAPVEQPLAGLGAVASWVKGAVASWAKTAEVVPAPAPVVEAVVAPVAEVVEAPPPVVEGQVEVTAAPVVEVEPVPAETETAHAPTAVEIDELEAAPLDADEIAEVEEAAEAAEAGEVTDGAEAVAEGSETGSASVREPNQRFPHRVSRRMRRKGRGGDRGSERGGERGADRQGAPASQEAQQPVVEGEQQQQQVVTAQAAAPVERQERNDRGERPERGSRDRGERTERSERGERTERPERAERPERERPPLPSISDLLKEGQEIVVQIAKEPIGQKGARITSHIALPGRFVVYMPTVEHVGVSRKIPSDEERQRLKRVLQTHRQGVPGGFICRTAADGKTEEELRVDMHFLYNLWLDMRQKAEKKPAPVLLHHDLDLVQRILRDQLTTSFKTIWVDNEELYESVMMFVERFQPALIGRVKLYTRSNPIFDEFGITAEVEKALRPKVWLKSGGYIVINQTEALVAIDINTGKYVGKSNRLEDTIVKINTDAIKEIVRQIRLRDLGGIIVVDFIDMDERKNRQKVMLALEEGMRADRAPYKILQFNDFGLVAITRKRVKQSLERTLCAPCPYCEGAGYIKSASTVISEILQEAQRMQKALATETGNVMLRVNPEVAKILKSNHNSFLQEIEEIVGRTIMVKSDPLLHQTKFDLA